MTPAPRAKGLVRASLTLLAGGALAQLIPLLLGPWLTRLYAPEEFGVYHVFAAVLANVAVIGCGRYEFALPKVADDEKARGVRALCLIVAAVVTLLTTTGSAVWAMSIGASWPLWLGPGVAVLALLSLATMSATRDQRFRLLGTVRVIQYGGSALVQGLAGYMAAGVHGLIVGPIAAAAAALAALGGPGSARATTVECKAAARAFREFPLLNTPHAFLGALQDTAAVMIVAASVGPAAAGAWGLALRYLKAPASLVGGAVSQALYPRLAQAGCTREGRALVVQAMVVLGLIATPMVALLWIAAPALFEWAFGPQWREAGGLASALALYIGLHFIASPMAVVTLAWDAQAWALRLSLAGQLAFLAALAAGLAWGGLRGAGWAVSAAMTVYFGWYFAALARWPIRDS